MEPVYNNSHTHKEKKHEETFNPKPLLITPKPSGPVQSGSILAALGTTYRIDSLILRAASHHYYRALSRGNIMTLK